MKLYAFTPTPNNRKVVALIKHYNLPIEIIPVSFRDQEHRRPDYLAINPMGKVPTLVDGDFNLWESNAILLYLCDCFPELPLSPKDKRTRADVNRWLHWQNYHFGPAVAAHMQGASEEHKATIKPWLDVLEQQLQNREFICGELSVADFAIGAYCLSRAGAQVDYSDYPAIKNWLDRVADLEGFKATETAIPSS